MVLKKDRHPVVCAYIRQYRFPFLLFAVYAFVYAFIFSLYRLEAEAVLYAAGLCAVFTVIALTAGFLSYRKKHLERVRLLRQIEVSGERLPEPETLAEADYQEMVIALRRMYEADLTAWQSGCREQVDYYTTWVHQIKSPIAVMRMMLQAEDTKEHRELLAELFRIEQYVEMVLSYQRLGGGATDFVFRECALDDVIRQAVHKYAPQFVRRRIRLSFAPSGVMALTDEKWLLFILEQLLSNAVKYTQKGTVTITAGPQPVITVADTGIGIAPEDVPRVFEKGFTGYNGRADKKATGLGLYLCRMAADKLSHRLTVRSQVGKGTVFTVDLRTADVDARE